MQSCVDVNRQIGYKSFWVGIKLYMEVAGPLCLRDSIGMELKMYPIRCKIWLHTPTGYEAALTELMDRNI